MSNTTSAAEYLGTARGRYGGQLSEARTLAIESHAICRLEDSMRRGYTCCLAHNYTHDYSKLIYIVSTAFYARLAFHLSELMGCCDLNSVVSVQATSIDPY